MTMLERVRTAVQQRWHTLRGAPPRWEILGGAAWRLAWRRDAAPHLREYLRYTAQCLARGLALHEASLEVVLGEGLPPGFGSGCRLVRAGVQFEHTLVRPGGRDSAGAPAGRVPLADGSGFYLARLAQRAQLESLDLVVDYSLPNIENLGRAGGFEAYLERCIHLAPLLCDVHLLPRATGARAITLFADTRQPRRRAFLGSARTAGLRLRNHKGIYSRIGLQELHDRSAILVNVHQTPDHHTFEELRVLPALMRGVLVVSEDVPLRQLVPYHEHVIWADHGQLAARVRAVQDDYAAAWQRVFGDGRFAALVAQMRASNLRAIESAIARFPA